MSTFATIFAWLFFLSSCLASCASFFAHLAGKSADSHAYANRSIGWVIASGVFFVVAK